MPRFFFHLQDALGRVVDGEGIPLPDEEAAFYHAFRRAADLLATDQAGDYASRNPCYQVEDEEGFPVFAVPLAQVLALSR